MKLRTTLTPNILFKIDTDVINNILIDLDNITSDEIDTLITGTTSFTLNKTRLTFLGKGDEGTVYDYDHIVAVKFFVKADNNELQYLELMKELYKQNIMFQTLMLYGHVIKHNHLITILNKADGNIDTWMKTLISDNPDIEWYHMLLQILYGVLVLQNNMIYHKDLLHRNILYKVLNEEVTIEYEIDDLTINFKTKTIFFITDFGKSQSLTLKTENTLTDEEIKEAIDSNKDLHGIASLYTKMFVDYIYHNVPHYELYRMIKHNKPAQTYLKQMEQKIVDKSKIIKKPAYYTKLQVTRALCYYLIEHDYIDLNNYKSKIKYAIPSNNVKKLLDTLTSNTIMDSIKTITKLMN